MVNKDLQRLVQALRVEIDSKGLDSDDVGELADFIDVVVIGIMKELDTAGMEAQAEVCYSRAVLLVQQTVLELRQSELFQARGLAGVQTRGR